MPRDMRRGLCRVLCRGAGVKCRGVLGGLPYHAMAGLPCHGRADSPAQQRGVLVGPWGGAEPALADGPGVRAAGEGPAGRSESLLSPVTYPGGAGADRALANGRATTPGCGPGPDSERAEWGH